MKQVYAIRLGDGRWAQGSSWKSTDDLSKAKIYGKIGTARQAISYHDNRPNWQGATIVSIEAYAGDNPDVEILKKFYGVETLIDLIEIQSKQIIRLQNDAMVKQANLLGDALVRQG